MEKLVILDEKDVRISLVDIEDATDSPNFRILIENNSSFDLDFSIDSFTINGYAVEGYLDADVRSRKRKFEYLYVEDMDWACLLSLVGLKSIEDICDLGFSFKIKFSGEDEEDDDEDFEDFEDFEDYEDFEEDDSPEYEEKEDESLYLLTSFYEIKLKDFIQFNSNQGNLVYSNKGLNVRFIGTVNDKYNVIKLIFLVENQMNKRIFVDLENVSLNDFMAEYDSYFECDLYGNTKRFAYLTFDEGYLREIGVKNQSDVDSLDFEVVAYDKKSHKKLVKSSNIRLG